MQPGKHHVRNQLHVCKAFYILLQQEFQEFYYRAEEMFPAVRESMVSVLTLQRKGLYYCNLSILMPKKGKYIVTSLCFHNPGLFFIHGCTHDNCLVYCSGECSIQRDWLGWSDSTGVRMRNVYKDLDRKPQRKSPLGDLCADGRILLR
jgi:hypothetical protein